MARLLMLVLALSCAGSARAQVWDALHGRWAGGGEVSGMKADVALEFRPALDGRAHHLAFSNRMRAGDGREWPFRAEAFYLCAADGACRGHWYDSRGAVLPLSATARADRLVVEWGGDDTERGRTTYHLAAADRLEITDEVFGKDGEPKVFGRTALARDPASTGAPPGRD